MNRRKFIRTTALSGLGLAAAPSLLGNSLEEVSQISTTPSSGGPLVIATWRVPNATQRAWEVLQAGGSALDAVEKGCNVEEEDPKNTSVGYGGFPDQDGIVSLDACIMDEKGNYGSVVFLQNIVHAISVARKVMEETPHVLLAGRGAEEFAVSKGFKRDNLLTETSQKAWEEWKIKSEYKPVINIENHDTIGMLVIDKNGNLSGGCTTSGMAFKMHGRVGDSPIIGSGLFVDNEVGAATATGVGEEVLKTVGSFLIVELMRQGKSPQEACEEAIERIMHKQKDRRDFQVGYIAVNKKGEVGSFSIHEGFNYQIYKDGENKNLTSGYYFQGK